MEWENITTAPKDEELELKTDYFTCLGFYDSADNDWFFSGSHKDGYVKIRPQPTHWKSPTDILTSKE